ncbi:hypothetical protein RRG08_029815 [Elysia crispata]|uniref:Uncharacterized protein n=1 Tax=Elysia crispata TaxID=231223 RepID=A0AAE1D1V9_9GAST|nr:hypothetical protein RRG08_029815 [Elysia crispata]
MSDQNQTLMWAASESDPSGNGTNEYVSLKLRNVLLQDERHFLRENYVKSDSRHAACTGERHNSERGLQEADNHQVNFEQPITSQVRSLDN